MQAIRGYNTPLGIRSPSYTAFLNRNSIGSIPSFSASSSITLSTAKVAGGCPGAR